MKRQMLVMLSTFCFGTMCFPKSIADAVRSFDTAVFNSAVSRADTVIGFINYGDSGTCGSVAPWIQAEIKKTAASTRRISIVESSAATLEAKTVVATRGAAGVFASAKKTAARAFVLSGTYYENGEDLELFLSLYDNDGRMFASETAAIPLSEIRKRKLTLYPANMAQAEQISKDIASAESEQNQKPTESSKSSFSFLITAAMLDGGNNLVDILHPNDTVRFMIATLKDTYIAILCIDANGDKNWLPVQDRFMRAGETRTFPDIPGHVFKVVDGVYGAEQILIYASTSPEGLPSQKSSGMYQKGDIQKDVRGIMAVREQGAGQYETGIFKIAYTVME